MSAATLASTAKALAKLGIAAQFIDGISTDKYGQMALKQLHKDGVLLDFVKFSDKPTCLAIYLKEYLVKGISNGNKSN